MATSSILLSVEYNVACMMSGPLWQLKLEVDGSDPQHVMGAETSCVAMSQSQKDQRREAHMEKWLLCVSRAEEHICIVC